MQAWLGAEEGAQNSQFGKLGDFLEFKEISIKTIEQKLRNKDFRSHINKEYGHCHNSLGQSPNKWTCTPFNSEQTTQTAHAAQYQTS